MPDDPLPLKTGTSPDPMENHKATKPAFNVWQLSVPTVKRRRFAGEQQQQLKAVRFELDPL